MKHSKLQIEKNRTVREAMDLLSQTAKKILFVVEGNCLVGTMTDGDIRRYLLSGGTLDDPADSAANHHPLSAESREDAEKLLAQCEHIAIPVVDKNGVLRDIVLRDKIAFTSAKTPLFIPVVIQAGGKGTRLAPYTNILPKPLIPVGDLPIIEHIMSQFTPYSCNEFHVIVNHKKQLIKAYFGENERSYDLHWYDEDKPLGTGGGLSLLKGHIHSTFFLINCDILLLSDYAEMLRYHKESGNAVTMVAARKHVTIPYGVVETGENGEIEAFREKPSFDFLTNTGMYIVEPEVLEDIEDGVSVGFPTIMEQQKEKGRKIGAYAVEEDDWLDMGQLEELRIMEQVLCFDKKRGAITK